jgi:alpha-ketoglutarate-dependent taurine dioxygenase
MVMLRGVASAADLRDLAQAIGTVQLHPHSDSGGVTIITERGSADGGMTAAGFTRAALPLHTDRADMPIPPPVLLTCCAGAATSGGASVLSDGLVLHRILSARNPDCLRALRERGAARYGRTHVYSGPVFEPVNEGRRLRLRVWPPEAAAFSERARVALSALHRTADEHATVIPLKKGEGYAVDNHRWMHGRHAYDGPRVMLRIAVEPREESYLETGIPPKEE